MDLSVLKEKAQWEYKSVHFDREEHAKFPAMLEELGKDGWEYSGVLCGNGLNAAFVAFKRPL